MALTRTTLSSAVAAVDLEVTLASITALAVGDLVKIDSEYMRVLAVGSAATVPVKVLRGVNGSNVVAHVTSASAVFGSPSDHTNRFAVESGRKRDVASYSAAGAITLPTPGRDMIAIINGTSALAMTLADPSKENEGDILIVAANGKAAHTLTYTNGFGDGGASYDVLTYSALARNGSVFVAVAERWVPCPSLIGGTATAVTQTIA